MGVPDPTQGALTWDAAVGKWIPAVQAWVSPDGTRYVTAELEVVDARTGAIVHRIPIPNGPGYVVDYTVGYTDSAIYLSASGKNPPPGLWKVDTASWKLTQIASVDAYWKMADASAVWGVYGGTTVKRMDPSTGKVTNVYTGGDAFPGDLVVAGLIASGAIVAVSREGFSGTEILSILLVHPDGSVVHFDVPPALQHATLWATFQDGPAVLFQVYYPLEPAGPPASLHGWGLAAFDTEHGLQFLMTNVPPGMTPAGSCMSI
jgi:hypothetical protein